MRPRQWTKNVLFVFPALVFDGQLFVPSAFLNVLAACILLILMSGTVYIINDLVDIEKDRQHPRKKNRPLPSGQLPQSLAIGAAVVIPTVTLLLAWVWNWKLGVVLVFYLLIQLAYSFYLKHVVVLDVLTVTAGFVLRVVAGVVVITVANFSPWLYAATGLLALFLVIGKRRQELVSLGAESLKTRPIFEHYNLALIDEMLRMVLISTFITYLLYTVESETVVKVTGVNISLITVPFVLYGLLHYMYLIHVKGEGGAPEELLLTDRTLQLTIALWGLTFVGMIYILPQVVR
jgi:4-hydroxybenzoate polyprenyltransferase